MQSSPLLRVTEGSLVTTKPHWRLELSDWFLQHVFVTFLSHFEPFNSCFLVSHLSLQGRLIVHYYWLFLLLCRKCWARWMWKVPSVFRYLYSSSFCLFFILHLDVYPDLLSLFLFPRCSERRQYANKRPALSASGARVCPSLWWAEKRGGSSHAVLIWWSVCWQKRAVKRLSVWFTDCYLSAVFTLILRPWC